MLLFGELCHPEAPSPTLLQYRQTYREYPHGIELIQSEVNNEKRTNKPCKLLTQEQPSWEKSNTTGSQLLATSSVRMTNEHTSRVTMPWLSHVCESDEGRLRHKSTTSAVALNIGTPKDTQKVGLLMNSWCCACILLFLSRIRQKGSV